MQMRELTKDDFTKRIPLMSLSLYHKKFYNKLIYTKGENMKEYEVIWEIFNKCPRNQMRDVFVDEVEIEDPEEYVKNKFREKK